jgi:hypothetical protein
MFEAMNNPLLNPYTLPTFENRLVLIAAQLQLYKHMYPLSDTLEKFARQLAILNSRHKPK